MKKTIHYFLVIIAFLFFPSSINAQVCNLVCSDLVNASLRADSCKRTFDPIDFLKNPDLTCSSYTIQLTYPFGTNSLDGRSVDASHIGYTFIYKVQNGANSCWGYVTIEDKATPLPRCKSATISCFQYSKINEIANQIIDNCTQEGRSIITDLKFTDLGCNETGITGQVIREIMTFDKWGNRGTCNDTLKIRKDSFSLVKAPDMITLSCLMSCKKPGNEESVSDPAHFDLISFSSNVKDPSYPSPAKLLELQARDTFGSALRKCIPAHLRVVPYITDSVFRWVGNECFRDDTCIAMYPPSVQLCKLFITYSDLTFPICGNGFKIRREWRLTDWCRGRDSLIVQYISVEDKTPPIVNSRFSLPFNFGTKRYQVEFPGYRINLKTNAHDCNAQVCIDSLTVADCSKVTQRYSITYSEAGKPGSIVKTGSPGECFNLPGNPNSYTFLKSLFVLSKPPIADVVQDVTMPRNCHIVRINTTDQCYNQTESPINVYNAYTGELVNQLQTKSSGFALICITDETPPNPVCNEISQTTIDPQTCWSRIYARDLDNGSKDNCCDLLHFAVANMDTVEEYKVKYAAQLEQTCGKNEFWKNKNKYDAIIEDWINCYVFNDYIDITECNEIRLILRVYEACGIPRLDEHIFKCGAHSWFCYNTYPLYMLWHNYQLAAKSGTYCNDPWPWLCLEDHDTKIADLLDDDKKYYVPVYAGATNLILNPDYPIEAAICFPFFYDPRGTNVSVAYAPGNTCSKRLYNDCMIRMLVDDKTPPVAEKPVDKFWYCDNVSSNEGDVYEYAKCNDDSYEVDNGKDKICKDQFGNPNTYIESSIENDAIYSDTINEINKYYGWYGCNVYNPSHDEHGNEIPCENHDSWAPVYCRSWLILDKKDAAGKINPKLKFDSPILKSGAPGSKAQEGRFYIWDNCWINPQMDSSDQEYFDNCGNGWIKRTWNAKDKCGNTVTVDQKIVTKHRSDFEVLFPADKISVCGNAEDISPDAIGRPMIMDDECELVGVNYDDQRFDIVPDACFKIIRTWRVVDWCKFNPNQQERGQEVIVDDRNVADVIKRPCVYRHVKDNGDGFISYTQVIVVKDTIRPEINLKDTTLCFYDNSCFIQSIHIPFSATDNCTKNEFLSYRYEIDENPSAGDLTNKKYNKGSIDKSNSNIKSLTSTQKVGTSLVHVIAEDNCGNEDTSSFVLTIKDCKKPTPYCYHGIATVVMPTTGTIKVWAKDFNAGSFDNCTPNDKLKFHFGKDIKDSCRIFDCKDIPNGVAFTAPIDIYVTDEAGNSDFCRTLIDIQDNSGNVCENAKSIAGSISGSVKTKADVQIENTLIEAIATSTYPGYKTTASGQYAFTNIPLKSALSLTASRNDEPTNGVTTTDILKIQRHLIGIEPFSDPYSFIAADVNNDKEITSLDLIELRKLILNVTESFATNTSWRFIPKSFVFDVHDPFKFTEKIDIQSLEQDELNKDFVGVKIGDINQSAQAHSLAGAESRNALPSLDFSFGDKMVNKDQLVSLDFINPDVAHLQAFQFTLAHKGLELVEIQGKSIDLNARNIGGFKDYFTISWNEVKSPKATTSKTLFTALFRATENVILSNSININSKVTPVEAFNGSEVLTIGVKWVNPISRKSAVYNLHQNTPNPFSGKTVISYELPVTEKLTLTITDLVGKTIYSQGINGKKGLNQWLIQSSLLPANGIYYYSIETDSFKDIKKMILVK